jgi:hypothetical protein
MPLFFDHGFSFLLSDSRGRRKLNYTAINTYLMRCCRAYFFLLFPRTCRSIRKGKKVRFLKSEKIGKKKPRKCKNAAAYAAERPLFLDSFLKLKSAAYKQEQLQIKSGL